MKDAGSASIYGVRGANGVIIVTTKRGRAGKTTISYDGYYGTQRPLSGNPYHVLINPQDLANALWKADIQSGQVDTSTNLPTSVQYGKGATPVLPDYISPGGKFEGDPAVNPALYNVDYNKGPIYQITKANKSGTDWYHAAFKPALMQMHTLTASGGGEKSTYLFSVGYQDQQGTLLATYLKRYSVRMNTTFNVKNHIRVGENAYLFYKENPSINLNVNSENVINSIFRMQSIIPVYDIKGNFAGTNGPELGNAHSVVADQTRTENNKGYTWDMVGNVFAEADFLKHFLVKTVFGGTMDNGYYNSYTFHQYENAENNSGNSFSENYYYNSSWTWTNTLSYSNVFAQKHSVKAIGGIEANNYSGRAMGGTRLNYFTDDPALRVLNAGSPTNQSLYGYSNVNTLYSLFGRLDYAFNEKYLLGATLRRDGSSNFGPQKKYGVFPSVSVGWRVSQEEFLKNVTWINELKLRGSWGKLGSQNNVNGSNQYNLYNSSASNSYYDINGTSNSIVQGFYQSQIGNPLTGWEEDNITNVGLDALIIDNHFDVSVEYYKKKINGLLFGASAGGVTGAGGPSGYVNALPTVNIGDVQNTGVDASVLYHATISRDIKLNLGANITTYKSLIVNIPGQYFDYASSRIGNMVRNEVGHPISAFYGYKIKGFFNSAADVAKAPTQQDAAPGRFQYVDVNGDGKIDASDRTFLGNPNPKFTYGFTVNASYKNFDFSMLLYGSVGNDVVNYNRYWLDFWASFQSNKSQDMLFNSWTPTHQNARVTILENKSTFSSNEVFNSYYIENGSYLRCKQLQIGYSLAPAILKTVGIEKLHFYVQAANLFTVTKYTGPDPELSGGNDPNTGRPQAAGFGIDYGNYPTQRTFIVGANITF